MDVNVECNSDAGGTPTSKLLRKSKKSARIVAFTMCVR